MAAPPSWLVRFSPSNLMPGTGVAPRPDDGHLGQLAACRLVGSRSHHLLESIFPVLCLHLGAPKQEPQREEQCHVFHHSVVFHLFSLVRGKPAAAVPVIASGPAQSSSSSRSHSAAEASEGMRQSPRGESETEPTFGPSGIAERLNCCAKKRRKKTRSHLTIVSRS